MPHTMFPSLMLELTSFIKRVTTSITNSVALCQTHALQKNISVPLSAADLMTPFLCAFCSSPFCASCFSPAGTVTGVCTAAPRGTSSNAPQRAC